MNQNRHQRVKNANLQNLSVHRQRGMALIISLIILTILTIVSLSSSQGIVLQEKMTGSNREAALAFMAAERGLEEAERYMDGIVTTASFNDNCDDGLCTDDNAPKYSEWYLDTTWDTANDKVVTVDLSQATGSKHSPLVDGVEVLGDLKAYYFIESLNTLVSEEDLSGAQALDAGGSYGSNKSSGSGEAFRIVVKGVGRDGETERVIESLYAKYF